MADHPPEHDPSSPPPRPDAGRWDGRPTTSGGPSRAINEWTRFADAKAAAVLTANGVLGTLAAGLIEKHWDLLARNQCLKIVALLCGLALLVSSFVCVKCLLPRLKVKGEFRSLLFFHHIALYDNPESYLAKAGALSDPDEAFREVGTQVWANAKVAREKHKEVALAIWLTGLSLLVALAAWIVAFLNR